MNLSVQEITPEVFVDKDKIISMEYESIGSSYWHPHRNGTTMTLINGRKIYVAGMTPKQIIEKLNAPQKEIT